MSAPVLAASATTNSASNTSHTVNLPSGIAAGHLLLVSLNAVSASPNITFPAGWTVLSSSTVRNGRNIVASRIADASEGASITVTASSAVAIIAISQRFTGVDPFMAPSIVANGNSGGTFGSQLDPAAVTPRGDGTQDFLQMVYPTLTADRSPSGASSTYNIVSGVQVENASFGMDAWQKDVTSAPDDPAAVSISGSRDTFAHTVLIYNDDFPTLRANPLQVNTNAAATSHTITLPTSSIDGDLMIASLALDGVPVLSGMTGWTQLFQTVDGANQVTLAVYYRIRQAGDANATLTTSSSVEMMGHTFAIRTGTFDAAASPYISASSTSGSSTNIDPPSHSPSYGANRDLYVACAANDNGATPTGTLTYFSWLTTRNNSGGATGVGHSVGFARDDSGTVDPANSWTITSDEWVAGTIAIRGISDVLLGSANVTLDDATVDATGQLAIKGDVSVTLDDATLSATGALALMGAAEVTLDDAALSAAGALAVRGELSAALEDAALDAAGTNEMGEPPAPSADHVGPRRRRGAKQGRGFRFPVEPPHRSTMRTNAPPLVPRRAQSQALPPILAVVSVTLDDATLVSHGTVTGPSHADTMLLLMSV